MKKKGKRQTASVREGTQSKHVQRMLKKIKLRKKECQNVLCQVLRTL